MLASQSSALDEYIGTLKSPISRIKVLERLDQVFKALDIPGSSVEERAENFAKKARDNNLQWLDSQMRRLVAGFKKRVEVEKDLKGITAKHYFSAIKNFCLINNTGITVSWLYGARNFQQQPLKQMSEVPLQKKYVCFSSMRVDG